MFKNTAAWVPGPKLPLEVKSAPYTRPLANEVVIRNHAVAVNPIDWIVKDMGEIIFGWIKYPTIFGCDVAGEVVEVGSSVTHFKIGDRVLSYALSMNQKTVGPSKGGFQLYTVLLEHMTSAIPATLSYEKAAVFPLGLATAAAGLFEKNQLGLEYPTVPKSLSNGKTLIIWGGSTSVGVNAIQLAVAAGYEVFTTCSPKNSNLVASLGASKTFDYKSRTVVSDMITALKGKTVAGALTMGDGGADACMDILAKCEGNKFISMATYPKPKTPPKRFAVPIGIYTFVSWSAKNWVKSKTNGVNTIFIEASTVVENGVGKMIFEDFLPRALEGGNFVAAPDPLVIGKGLEFANEAVEKQKAGVSAKKVMISL
ncbi:Dehydrogenase azaJ [Hyphodiscus hymeniophilus]|uniref:Dehydrogenase azaJ n=1 Tax=Hyphodiscus hymeniophilus TaxID=353542 RepID=A0A9P7B0D8_9HELO|nr:Dehydrogenase azaJ [Hyphodiscus hymeniophilus]